MSLYSGLRGRGLDLIYKYLLSIPPAAVEAEQAFSATGTLCTKSPFMPRWQHFKRLVFLVVIYRDRKRQASSQPRHLIPPLDSSRPINNWGDYWSDYPTVFESDVWILDFRLLVFPT